MLTRKCGFADAVDAPYGVKSKAAVNNKNGKKGTRGEYMTIYERALHNLLNNCG